MRSNASSEWVPVIMSVFTGIVLPMLALLALVWALSGCYSAKVIEGTTRTAEELEQLDEDVAALSAAQRKTGETLADIATDAETGLAGIATDMQADKAIMAVSSAEDYVEAIHAQATEIPARIRAEVRNVADQQGQVEGMRASVIQAFSSNADAHEAAQAGAVVEGIVDVGTGGLYSTALQLFGGALGLGGAGYAGKKLLNRRKRKKLASAVVAQVAEPEPEPEPKEIPVA